MAQNPKNPQQSRIQNSPPKRKPHIPNRRQTQNHSSTPQNHQKRNPSRNHTTSRTNKRGIPKTIDEKIKQTRIFGVY